MAGVKRGVTARARHKKILDLAEGMQGERRIQFRTANEAVMHSLSYQYRDRKLRKGDMRALWITRINAAARQNGLAYNQFRTANEAVMHSLSYQYRDRKLRKGDMRALWITRINAAARQNGLAYNQF